jgi:cytochrome b561
MIFNTLYYWGTPAKLLHWAGALMILFLYFHGLIVVGEDGSLERANDPQVFLHAATVVTLGLMMLGRYVWRLINKIPLLPAKTPEWEKMLAGVAHVGLYVATLFTIFAGWFLAGALAARGRREAVRVHFDPDAGGIPGQGVTRSSGAHA